MSSQDKNGWWAVTARSHWTCPECKETSPVEEWEECEVGCEDCGSHEARRCPKCGEAIDSVFGDARIEEASKAKEEENII